MALFSAPWKAGKATDWPGYWDAWGLLVLTAATTWAVIPDVIDGGTQLPRTQLLAEWPHRQRAGRASLATDWTKPVARLLVWSKPWAGRDV